MTGPSIITTSALAAVLGVAESTVRTWKQKDVRLRGCIVRETIRSTWWSVPRLQALGYLACEKPAVVHAGPAFEYRIAQ